MPELKKREKGFSLDFSAQEVQSLGLSPAREYEVSRAKPGVFLLTEGKEKKACSPEKELEEKLLKKLSSAQLSERVEGKFEESLNEKERDCFKRLREAGGIVPFKLSDKYKKAIYKTKLEIESNAPIAKQGWEHKPKGGIVEAFSLEKDDFTVTRNESKARQLSREFSDQIRKKEVFGVKSFGGEYFVIKKELYDKHSQEILKYIGENSPVNADALSDALNLKKPLVRAVCEFLKEEGEITEKRKELYAYVS